ncbi:MAG: DUF2179 domain-containing protein [Spirochaetia bacterium]|jgi:uncharacterized protein YebE (UPF0316 family)|nr:DUF2179 domain-containing protein [Spirochaetia bacterium]
MNILGDPFFSWVILPLLIFFARIADVTIGTMRIVFISRGHKIIAPLLGFCEVVIWLVALTKIMENLSNPLTYFAYGAGFAMGTYIGISLEERLAMGKCIIRSITAKNANELVKKLRLEGYGVTVLEAEGNSGKVAVFYSIINRSCLPGYINIINTYNSKAFYTIEDVRFVNEGYFPIDPRTRRGHTEKKI